MRDAGNFELLSPGLLKSGALNSLFCDSSWVRHARLTEYGNA